MIHFPQNLIIWGEKRERGIHIFNANILPYCLSSYCTYSDNLLQDIELLPQLELKVSTRKTEVMSEQSV